MNNKFLNRVVGHIVKETIMDYVRKTIITPYSPLSFPYSLLPSSPSLLPPSPYSLSSTHILSSSSFSFHYSSFLSFTQHCENIYGLKPAEIEYIYEQYRDKINKELA